MNPDIPSTSEGPDRAPVPALPETPANPDANEPVRTLKLGESIDFAHLGPVIINSDGTTRRIANWDSMTKQEQDKTWERISKRNAARIAELKKNAPEP